jgi:hypothetical protein
MKKKPTQFSKIQQFVTEQYNQLSKTGAVIVNPVASGYRVNEVNVKAVAEGWQVVNGSIVVATMRQRRLAILTAALITKKRFKNLNEIILIDRLLDVYLEDKNMFSIRIKMNPDRDLYKDRLSKAENEILLLEEQIRELEKTVSLQ